MNHKKLPLEPMGTAKKLNAVLPDPSRAKRGKLELFWTVCFDVHRSNKAKGRGGPREILYPGGANHTAQRCFSNPDRDSGKKLKERQNRRP